MDPRYEKLAEVLVGYSTSVKRGESVMIDAFDVPDDMVIALIRSVRRRKAHPFIQINRARLSRELLFHASKKQYTVQNEIDLNRMKKMDAYIALRGSQNIFELSDVPSSAMKLAMGLMKPVLDWRVKKTRWVVLRWPTGSMAQQSLTSTEAFEDFYFKVCTLDYSRMIPGMNALKHLMEKTDCVRITGGGTDLAFSIKNMGAVTCGGSHNIPDGEVFSCPVRDSVEGVLQYNCPSVYQGVSFDRVRFVFKKGKIVEASASANGDKIQEILNSDEGARYIGEFSLGFNPHILHPLRDILFDEKIAGSFHFTPGQAYEETDNGNKSQVHWDLVCIQRPDYGGGEIWFDEKLIRKDGIFVSRSLQKLNPDYLLGKE